VKIDTADIRLDTDDIADASPEKVRAALVWLGKEFANIHKAVSDAGLVRELDEETVEWAPRLHVANRWQFGAWLAEQLMTNAQRYGS
jgi:hypothetical protein